MIAWTKAIVFRTSNPMVNPTELSAGQRYRVRVRAGNSGGLSIWSDPVMFNATGSYVFIGIIFYYLCTQLPVQTEI